MPLSVTILSSTRTRCSSRSLWAAYCAAFSAVLRPIASTSRSLIRSHWRSGTIRIATIGINSARMGMSMRILSMAVPRSVAGSAQIFDFLGDPVAVVGDDPLDIGEPVLDRAQLGAQLGVLAAEQLQAFGGLGGDPGLDRLAPARLERVAMLDPEQIGRAHV